jgi:hypothetical protein
MAGLFNVDLGTALSGIGTLAKDIRTAITGKEPISAERAAELALKVQELELETLRSENSLLQVQAEINKVEAASPNLFIAGWRPAVGWICGLALLVEFVVKPWLAWGLARSGHPATLPELDMAQLVGLLVGMLGMAGYRTYEKKTGASGKH